MEKSIEDCLRSILEQTLPKYEYEVIVVDDGSSDNTTKIVKKYPVILIKQDNKGPASARNHGAKIAQAPILIFTDGDCELDKNFLIEMLEPFKSDEIIGVQGRYKTKQKGLTPRFCQIEIEERYDIYKNSKSISMIGTYAAAYRKDIFIMMGMFDTRFPIASGEDAALSLKMVKNGHKLIFQDKAICYHRHPESFKHYYKQKYGRAYWRNLLYKMNPEKMVKDNYTPQLLKLQVLVSLFFYCMIVVSFFAFLLNCYSDKFGYLLLAIFLLSFITTIPFFLKSIKLDKVIFLFIPIYSILRSFALANGLIKGFLDIHIIRRKSI
jgi:cellulose synthase/poly-beta-1,6-N-acetylglucosamine synthase-like glycosyltransferase